MDIALVMQAVADRLGTIAGTRIYAFPADSVAVPALIVGYPEINFDLTFRRGSDRMSLPVWLVVSDVSDRAARDALAAFVKGAGVKSVLESGAYPMSTLHTLRVETATPGQMTIGGIEYDAYRFDVDITGAGG